MTIVLSFYICMYIHTHPSIDIMWNDIYHVEFKFLITMPQANFFFISWRLITLQYCSGFCHTLT